MGKMLRYPVGLFDKVVAPNWGNLYQSRAQLS